MDTVIDRPWTTETFLAWEDRQEFKYEFDGREIIPISGGTIAHQRISGNLWVTLLGLPAGRPLTPVLEMRLRIGTQTRYPDGLVFAGPLDQTTGTLTDAIAIFEVLSPETATIDRVDKLIAYASVPSLRCYVLLEQTAVAATVFRREPGGPWVASAHTGGSLDIAGIDLAIPLADLHAGLMFTA